MPIAMNERYTLAEVDDMFRQRIRARMLDVGLSAYDDTANSDAIIQAKRLFLASAVLHDPTPYISAFAWWMVSISSYASGDDITDQQIINNIVVTGAFDQIADQMIEDAEIIVQESQGVTAFGAAVTSVASIAHGLGTAPTADKFWFAFAADPLAAGHAWVSSITSTTFTLNIKAAPGGAGTSVAWRVKL